MISEENLDEFIRKRIKELRQNADLSINSLAYKCGISQSYLRDIELGNKRTISVEKLFYICAELNISLSDFFNEDITPQKLTPLEKKLNNMTTEQKEKLYLFLDTFN